MDTCLFCSIISKKIPASLIVEDDYTLAFLDIHPTNPGHVLVVPKTHVANIHTADKDTLHKIMDTVQKVARAAMKGLDASGYNVFQNNGEVAGQAVFHLHFHIIPRFEGDGFIHWKGQDYESDVQMNNVADRIIHNL